MSKAKKSNFKINIIRVGDKGDEIVRALLKEKLEIVLAKNNAVSDNLDEVLCKYISEEMRNEQKRLRQGLR